MLIKMVFSRRIVSSVPLLFLACAACSMQSRTYPRYQVSSWGTGSGGFGCYVLDTDSGDVVLYEGKEGRPTRQVQLKTSLAPRDAVYRAMRALWDKLGLAPDGATWVSLDGTKIYGGRPADPAVNARPTFELKDVQPADRFSASGSTATANHSVTIDAEWMADDKTELTVQSDLPQPQTALVVMVIREAVGASQP